MLSHYFFSADEKDTGMQSKHLEMEKIGSRYDEELPRIKDRPRCIFLQGAESVKQG